jgi:phospholipid/cholesterol/gamma-HCH transport system permease protein
MASASLPPTRRFFALGQLLASGLVDLGDVSLFASRVINGVFHRAGRAALTEVAYNIGILSLPVVCFTGLFIGMVLAVQAYAEFHQIGMSTRLGSIISISVVRELGPVLAATMLAGRVGSAMAAELATMRITEQVDALACLGVNPVHYLASPRFQACVLLVPLLTIVANFMGVMGGALICIGVYHIEPHYYWEHTHGFIELWDLLTGLIKPLFFGAAIGIISCHRGLYSEPGAEGVGRAATRAFVASFLAILVLDFFLALQLNNLYEYLWPTANQGFK